MPATAARAQPTPLLDFVLDTERRAGGAQLASAALSDLRLGLPGDTIRRADLMRFTPGDRTLVTLRISGAAAQLPGVERALFPGRSRRADLARRRRRGV